MQWTQKLTIPLATTDAEPTAAPQNVPDARLVKLPERDSQANVLNTRLIVALQAPLAQDISFEVYACDADTEDGARADRKWFLVYAAGPLGGGAVSAGAGTGFVGGGLFYFRVITNNLAVSPGTVLIRATNS